MATVYILKSASKDKYYIGSCQNLEGRVEQHRIGKFATAYTRIAIDWTIFYAIEGLSYEQARKIEGHFKRMKSRKYLQDLKRYPEIAEKLRLQYP